MSYDFQVTIHDSARAREWQEWIGTDTVYVKSPIPHIALHGEFPERFYLLDTESLSIEQYHRLTNALAEKWELSVEEILEDISTCGGIPILAKDCSVTVLNPQRWLYGFN